MSYQALYRKWRPETFDKVIGQDAVMLTLKNQVRSGRVGHAYLFCGTRGTGKTSAAKILARAVNCPHAAENGGNPCNTCEICEAIKSGASMSVFEIDAASNNGVDNIRDIRDEVEYPPVIGSYKVYIIDEVHMLSAGAFNALLKTLEEPPSYVIFILATTDPQKIPATILSRCQRYDFRRMSSNTAAKHLKEITVAEGMEVEDKALSYIAEAADGSMRDALSILDQCMAYHYGGRLSYENVLNILGAADTAVFSRLYRQIIKRDPEGVLKTLNELINSGADIIQITNDLIWYLRNVLLSGSIGDGGNDVLDISIERFEQARADASIADKRELLSIIGALAELVNRSRFSSQKRVLLEVELLRLSTAGNSAGGAARQAETATYAVRPEMHTAAQGKYTEADSKKQTEDVIRSSPQSVINESSSREAGPLNGSGDIRSAAQNRPVNEDAAKVEAQSPEQQGRGVSESGRPDKDSEAISILRNNWQELVDRLQPSNRPLFGGAILKEENGAIVVVFKNMINYKIAAGNTEENGLTRLRELMFELYGKNVKLMARIARPGEIDPSIDKATDEELSRINFHIDIGD